MSFKSNLPRAFFSFCLIAFISFSALADTIRLKDGSIIKGKIVSFGGGKFVVAIGDGSRRREMSFAAGDIESIQFDRDEAVASRPVKTSNQTVFKNTSQTTVPSTNPRVVATETAPPKSTPTQVKPAPPTSTAITKPVVVSVKVLADNTSNGWTNSGWVVKKGQKIRITGDGEISLGGKSTNASGLYDLEDEAKLMKNVPTGALIAVIGDDNNEFIYIGATREFTAARDGALFLGVNEGNLNDNSGSFDVKIEIEP